MVVLPKEISTIFSYYCEALFRIFNYYNSTISFGKRIFLTEIASLNNGAICSTVYPARSYPSGRTWNLKSGLSFVNSTKSLIELLISSNNTNVFGIINYHSTSQLRFKPSEILRIWNSFSTVAVLVIAYFPPSSGKHDLRSSSGFISTTRFLLPLVIIFNPCTLSAPALLIASTKTWAADFLVMFDSNLHLQTWR